MKIWLSLVLTVAVLGLMPSLCHSHKVSVFALVEGEMIIGETYFSGGRPAKHSRILVLNGDTEEELLTLQTDDQGRFSFPVPDTARNQGFDLKIVLLAGEAHRNEWLIEADDYRNSGTSAGNTVPPPDSSPRLLDILAGLGCILGGGVLIWLIRLRKRNDSCERSN